MAARASRARPSSKDPATARCTARSACAAASSTRSSTRNASARTRCTPATIEGSRRRARPAAGLVEGLQRRRRRAGRELPLGEAQQHLGHEARRPDRLEAGEALVEQLAVRVVELAPPQLGPAEVAAS